MVHTIVQAVGLVFVFEGLIYAVVPRVIKRMMVELPKLSDDQLRITGVAVLAFGVGIVWLAKVLT